MAKIDFKSLLTKLSNIFPKDIYVIHNWCVIAGDESDIETRGQYLCILEPDVREMLNSMFPNNPIIYIKSVRETKLKLDFNEVQEILDTQAIKNITAKVESLMGNFTKYSTWESFEFTDDQIESLFDIGESITLFENHNDRSQVIVSKSLFPLITAKTIGEVRYTYDHYASDDSLDQLTIAYEYDMFQLVMLYLFLKI